MGGFTYNGIHSSQFNVEYVPNAEARWWSGPAFETYQKNVSWKNGGYMYGNAVNIREIQLDCYFEEISIATREKIRQWLGRNTSGQLIIDDRPFVYYKVCPGEIVTGKIYNDTDGTYSGTFSVKFVAVDPFGYLTRKSNTGEEDDNASDYCGIVASSDMPSDPTTSSTSFDIYNPGTEACGLLLEIAGSSSNPIRFVNDRNNTKCVIGSLPENGVHLQLNGDTGNVTVYSNGATDNGFAYHDYGMIRLEPDTGGGTETGTKNHIAIQEQTSNGNWTTPSTLSLSYIKADYNPRLL